MYRRDHAVLQKCPLTLLCRKGGFRGEQINSVSGPIYSRAGVVLQEGKVFRYITGATVRGSDIDGRENLLGVAEDKRALRAYLTL